MQMFSNNKNKKSKELTLEQIIQKSTFRKTIDNLCLLQKKINHDPINKIYSLNTTPLASFAKPSKEFTKIQPFNQKKTYQSTKQVQKINKNQITARTTRSQKINTNNFNRIAAISHPYETIQNREQEILPIRAKQNKSERVKIRSLERTNSVKNKNKKSTDYLCVKGGSGTIINCPKPYTADGNKRGLIPEYEIKKYQTVVQLGGELPNTIDKQKQINPKSQQQIQKFHSFILTKYSTSTSIRQRSSSNKSYSHSKFKRNILLPDQLIQKKMQYKGIKTQQKCQQSKLQNQQNILISQKSKRLKKYQLVLNINSMDENQEIKKNGKGKQNQKERQKNNKKESQENNLIVQNIQEQNQSKLSQKNDKNQLIQLPNEDSLAKTKNKGFKGTKIKSEVNFIKTKSKYFIPDFIKPSLDLVVFQKKPGQRIRTDEQYQQKQIKQKKDNMNLNQNEYLEYIQGVKLQLNSKILSNQQLLNKNQKDKDLQQEVQNDQNDRNQQKGKQNQNNQNIMEMQRNQKQTQQIQNQKLWKNKFRKNNSKRKKVLKQPQICGWDQNQDMKRQSQLILDSSQLDY